MPKIHRRAQNIQKQIRFLFGEPLTLKLVTAYDATQVRRRTQEEEITTTEGGAQHELQLLIAMVFAECTVLLIDMTRRQGTLPVFCSSTVLLVCNTGRGQGTLPVFCSLMLLTDDTVMRLFMRAGYTARVLLPSYRDGCSNTQFHGMLFSAQAWRAIHTGGQKCNLTFSIRALNSTGWTCMTQP